MKIAESFEGLVNIIRKEREGGKKIVLTQGSFDLVHIGHARYLQKAKDHGDFLVVGIDSDAKIKARKGPDRPIVPEDERMEMLTHIKHVDLVVLKDIEMPKIYIDKLPLNIVHVAEIFSFFPNSKFILALRNPYDVVLSCFMQYFGANSAMLNFTSLKDTAKLYDLVMSLWLIYFEKFPIKVHKIKYEQIVQDFDQSVSKLLSFLELKWSDNVKEFYKTAERRGIVNTPSYRQINQPLYKKSIERWKNYEGEFSEVKQILDKWKQIFNY